MFGPLKPRGFSFFKCRFALEQARAKNYTSRSGSRGCIIRVSAGLDKGVGFLL